MDTWEKLVGRHQADVKTLVLHLLGPEEVEDVTQEVFMRAFRSLSGFRGDCSFATWLYHITVNLCRDRLRRRQTRRYNAFSLDEPILAEEGEVGRQLADPSPGPLECLERAELQQQIYAALDRLSEVHRTVLVLHDLQGLRYDEVARLMGCSVGTVKSRLFYARRKLSQLLADYCLE